MRKKTPRALENLVRIQAAMHVQARAAVRKLTSREKVVAALVWAQLSDKVICAELGVGISTLCEHKTNLFRKMAINTRVGIALTYERSLHSSPGRPFPWAIPAQKRHRNK